MAKGGFGNRSSLHIEVRRDGAIVASELACVAPCQEDALFEGVVVGHVPNDGRLPSLAIAPSRSGRPDPPSAAGDTDDAEITGVELRLGDAPPHVYGKEVFAAQAQSLITGLVVAKKLAVGEDVEWRLVERPDDAPESGFGVRVAREALPLSPARLPRVEAGRVGVELDPALLDRLRRDFCEAGAVERAWLLVGSVDHDAERGAASVSALTAVDVATGRGGASRTHFAFEPGPFIEARQRALRDFDGLVPIGWAHSHPPCEACPANPACQADTRFFSADDVEVHTSAFVSSYMIALVVGKVATAPATEPGFRLYGWRNALVTEIEYRVAEPGHG